MKILFSLAYRNLPWYSLHPIKQIAQSLIHRFVIEALQVDRSDPQVSIESCAEEKPPNITRRKPYHILIFSHLNPNQALPCDPISSRLNP